MQCKPPFRSRLLDVEEKTSSEDARQGKQYYQ
jgi:hypothetical protein